MSSQLWNEVLKNSFEVAAKKRSHQLTLGSVLLTAVIVKSHCVFAPSNWECPSEHLQSLWDAAPSWCFGIMWQGWLIKLGFRLMPYWPGPEVIKECHADWMLRLYCTLSASATLPGHWPWLKALHFFKNIWSLPGKDHFCCHFDT